MFTGRSGGSRSGIRRLVDLMPAYGKQMIRSGLLLALAAIAVLVLVPIAAAAAKTRPKVIPTRITCKSPGEQTGHFSI